MNVIDLMPSHPVTPCEVFPSWDCSIKAIHDTDPALQTTLKSIYSCFCRKRW